MEKQLSKAQIEELKNKVARFNGAKQAVDEFVAYLSKEHEVDQNWQITPDLTKFVKVEKPKEPKEEDGVLPDKVKKN